MKSGRKPLPPSQKRARGTYQPCRNTGLTEVEAPDDLPQAPAWLTTAGKEAWLDLIPRVVKTHGAREVDSVLVGTLANLIGACAAAWNAGAAPPAAYLAELRRLSEMFRLAGDTSRLIAGVLPVAKEPNPFAALRPPPDLEHKP